MSTATLASSIAAGLGRVDEYLSTNRLNDHQRDLSTVREAVSQVAAGGGDNYVREQVEALARVTEEVSDEMLWAFGRAWVNAGGNRIEAASAALLEAARRNPVRSNGTARAATATAAPVESPEPAPEPTPAPVFESPDAVPDENSDDMPEDPFEQASDISFNDVLASLSTTLAITKTFSGGLPITVTASYEGSNGVEVALSMKL